MTTKRLRLALASGSIATAAFIAGQYYERNTYHQTYFQKIQMENALNQPIFAPFLSSRECKPSLISTPIVSTGNKVKSFFKKILPDNSLKADSGAPPAEIPSKDDPKKVNEAALTAGKIAKYGLPGFNNIQLYSDYLLSYDAKNKIAYWVLERLTAESVKRNKNVDRSKCEFKTDNTVHPLFRSYNSDYIGSGYDRGHLAAAGNHKREQKHIEDTFFLTNIAPQVGVGFNRDVWNKLEKYVRSLTKQYLNVYCCTGPLYLPRKEPDGRMYIKYEVIGPNYVAVPTHFFKVVVGEQKDGVLDMECYVLENAKIDETLPLSCFQVFPSIVERAAGFLFFDAVAKRNFRNINGHKPI